MKNIFFKKIIKEEINKELLDSFRVETNVKAMTYLKNIKTLIKKFLTFNLDDEIERTAYERYKEVIDNFQNNFWQ